MRAYSFFAVLFFILGAAAIIVGGPPLIQSYNFKDPNVESAVLIFRHVVIIFFGAGFVVSSLIFLVKRTRGFSAYKRIIDRLSHEGSMSFNLNVSFPERDEFGNLGSWLNKFIEQMKVFDRIKVERLRASQQKIVALSEMCGRAIILLSDKMKIIYANSHFKNLLKIGEKNIIGLPVDSVMENEKLVNVLNGLEDKPKNQVLTDLKIKSGDVTYKSTIAVVPIISSDVRLMETMVIFDYIQKKVLPI
jgi:transcriptional regulator with PAS, ATPase and Fis domain